MNRLKGGLSPMPVGVVHVCIAFREAVAVVRLARYISQQFLHGLVKVFLAVVGHLQFVLAVRPPLGVVLFKAIALNVFRRTLLAAHELAVVLDTQRQKNRGGLGIAASGRRLTRSRPRRFFVGADLDVAMTKIPNAPEWRR